MTFVKYDIIKNLGKGGNGSVVLVKNKTMPQNIYACKIIPKSLNSKYHSETKIKNHFSIVQNEIDIMKMLENEKKVVKLHEVIEDELNFYLVMENCDGGDIRNYLTKRNNVISEENVRDIIRECMIIIAQCHEKNIIHNDIKPENFLFANDKDISSIKITDFGISINENIKKTYYLNDMTAWYASPESLSSKTSKKSDVWSIGVMTHLLLTGIFPFNDKKNVFNPSICKVWNSILNDNIDVSKSYWKTISNEAKNFVTYLLEKDVDKRPTIYEALTHPWITKKTFINNAIGKRVIDNISKYCKKNIIMRTIYEELVEILLTKYTRDEKAFEKLKINPDSYKQSADNDDSLYNSNKAITSLNSSKLSYILHVLLETGVCLNKKITKKSIKKSLKRLNSKEELCDVFDHFNNDENMDITTIISSQIDWDILENDTETFKKFISLIFDELNSQENNKDLEKQKNKIICNDDNVCFEDFFEYIKEIIQRSR
jgi:serine/threonine protein kinase